MGERDSKMELAGSSHEIQDGPQRIQVYPKAGLKKELTLLPYHRFAVTEITSYLTLKSKSIYVSSFCKNLHLLSQL